jgi:hypothetical protein
MAGCGLIIILCSMCGICAGLKACADAGLRAVGEAAPIAAPAARADGRSPGALDPVVGRDAPSLPPYVQHETCIGATGAARMRGVVARACGAPRAAGVTRRTALSASQSITSLSSNATAATAETPFQGSNRVHLGAAANNNGTINSRFSGNVAVNHPCAMTGRAAGGGVEGIARVVLAG